MLSDKISRSVITGILFDTAVVSGRSTVTLRTRGRISADDSRLHHLHLRHHGNAEGGGDSASQRDSVCCTPLTPIWSLAGHAWSQCHSLAFDFSVWEIWGALLYGGRVVVVPDAVVRSPEDLHALLVSERVGVSKSNAIGVLCRCRPLMQPQPELGSAS